MMKKIVKRLFALAACAVMLQSSYPLNTYADEGSASEPENEVYVYDYADILKEWNESDLNSLLFTVTHNNYCEVALATTADNGGTDLKSYTMNLYKELDLGYDSDRSGILLCYSTLDKDWRIVGEGLGLEALTDEGLDNFPKYIDPLFKEGRFVQAFETFGNIMNAYLRQAHTVEPYKDEKRVVDRAGIISDDKEAELLKMCDEISERQKFEVVIVTENDIGGRTSRDYTDDYYDYSGFGLDDKRSGICLLISMKNRDWAISTCGDGIPYFTDKGQEYIISEIKGYLSSGEYEKAFDLYARLCDDYINEAREKQPYDVGHLPEHSLRPYREELLGDLVVVVPFSAAIAFVIWLIICTIEKHKLTSVQFKGQADDYIRRDSIVINKRNDTFLYKNTTKRYNPPSSSSGGGGGGGSSSHHSSSGSSHGGSSGHF